VVDGGVERGERDEGGEDGGGEEWEAAGKFLG
jgi:hypothetical protein